MNAASVSPIKFSPVVRNAMIASYLLIHAYGADDGQMISYFIVARNVEAEIRGSSLAGVAANDNEIIEGQIMAMTSALIRAGIIECNTYDAASGTLIYRESTEIRLSLDIEAALDALPAHLHAA